MNEHEMKGNWNQLKGKIKQKWGKLTDDDLDQAEGKRDVLVGKIQEQYGISEDAAKKQVEEFNA